MATSGVFGQPLDQVIFQDQPPFRSGFGTPAPTTPTYGPQLHLSMPSSTSPTSLTGSEASYVENEMNPTAILLDALSISPSYPSPKLKRRMSLCPAEPQVPTIVTKAISYLDTKGVKTEGLFRISGAKSRINEVRLMHTYIHIPTQAYMLTCIHMDTCLMYTWHGRTHACCEWHVTSHYNIYSTSFN